MISTTPSKNDRTGINVAVRKTKNTATTYLWRQRQGRKRLRVFRQQHRGGRRALHHGNFFVKISIADHSYIPQKTPINDRSWTFSEFRKNSNVLIGRNSVQSTCFGAKASDWSDSSKFLRIFLTNQTRSKEVPQGGLGNTRAFGPARPLVDFFFKKKLGILGPPALSSSSPPGSRFFYNLHGPPATKSLLRSSSNRPTATEKPLPNAAHTHSQTDT